MVALLAERAEVEYDRDLIKDPAELVEVVEDAGFDGGLISNTDPKQNTEVIEIIGLL